MICALCFFQFSCGVLPRLERIDRCRLTMLRVPYCSMAIASVASMDSSRAHLASSVAQGSPAMRRMIASIVMLCSGAVLGLAAWLTPSPTGIGTHQQLHMPQCGWIALADIPCPTCGMTTAFAHAAHGHLWSSFLAQPLGCALAVSTAMAFLVSTYVTATGSRLGSAFKRLWGRRSGWLLAAVVLVAWGYKIASYKGLI